VSRREASRSQQAAPLRDGLVSLVGAGPGDPGLITVAGLDRLREADVIVYDRLVAPVLLGNARPDAELIYVGKLPSPAHGRGAGGEGSSHDQEAINQLLIEKAREGKRVVRLKGGDPFVFGRGGEEAEALRAAGIPFEVVPGVTSAIAVPAYAGIPVTHRGIASSFAVITGHEADPPAGADGALSTVNYQLSTQADTLVFLMGTKTLPDIVDNLIASGRSPDTPVAVIRWGTTPEQQTVVGVLADIVARVEDAGLTPPAITVVGEVVRLRETLSWFESRPLFGKRVLITRTRKQASQLARLLAAEGAIPIELPAIEIEITFDPAAVDAALEELSAGCYAWTVFTSANAVELWFELMRERNLDARAFGRTKVTAIGPATAEALSWRGITADLVPGEYIAEGVVDALCPHVGAGDRILLPRAENARPELVDGLRAAGADVNELTLYRAAVPPVAQGPSPESEALSLLRDGSIDIVTFTSSSTVRNLAAMLNGDISALTSADAPSSVIRRSTNARAQDAAPSRRNLGGEAAPARAAAPRRLLIACIGPITAETARELGLRVDLVAKEHTVKGLVRALRKSSQGGGS
jgi:uroporphyrinogen III methyltransferase/synthase